MSTTSESLTQHDISKIDYKYANVVMLQMTPVDLGIGFGTTEFVDAERMTARYHTMMRLSFEQAKQLQEMLQQALENNTSSE